MTDPTLRFSNRVEHYVRARPGYPAAILKLLESECGLSPVSVVADVGSGTGIFSRLLLERAGRVFAVEPNRAMREAAERAFANEPRFESRDGTAEATGMPVASVDLVTAAQAFHWFDLVKARREFGRILRPGGWIVLLWNERENDASPFMRAYEALLREFGTDYERVSRLLVDADAVRVAIGIEPLHLRTFENAQTLDRDGLRGRLLSTSYVPAPGAPRHDEMLAALERLFGAHQRDGTVTLVYRCDVYYGRA